MPKPPTSKPITMRYLLNRLGYGLIICGILLRLASLLNSSLEYDELFTAITVNPTVSFWWIIKNYLIIDVHPPLFNYLLWLWNHAGPWTSEIYMHSFSLLCSLLAVGIGWFCFPKRLGRTVRFIFMGLLCCGTIEIFYYLEQARSYSLLLLCSVALTFSALEVWYCLQKNKPLSWRNYGVFCISGLLAGYTHYFGLATFCAFALFLVGAGYYFRRCVWKMVLGYAGVFLLCLGWLIPNVLQNIYQGRFSGDWWPNDYYTWSLLVSEFSNLLWNNKRVALAFAVANIGLFSWWFFHRHQVKYQRFNGEMICLLAAILLVFAAVGVVSMRAFMFVPRFFFALFPAFFLLEALLLTPWIRRHSWILLLFVCYLGYNIAMYRAEVSQYTDTRNAKSFAQYFMSQSDKKDLFVLAHYAVPPIALQPMMSWYLNVYYKQPTPVTVLTTLSENDFNEALKRKQSAIIWFPWCVPYRVHDLEQILDRKIYIKREVDTSCDVTLEKEEMLD